MNQTQIHDRSPLGVLAPLIPRYGVTCSLEEFQEAVNVVFHDMESSLYDEIHVDMWKSLPRQFQLLADDIAIASSATDLRLLDIGSGTGLSAVQLLETSLGSRIKTVHLLDTSTKMLDQAREKLTAYPVQVETTHGPSSSLDAGSGFDVIVTSSVLHHVPDLADFCGTVCRLQRDGGFFVHLQDPNADSHGTHSRVARECEWKQRSSSGLAHSLGRWAPQRLASSLVRRLIGRQNRTYIDRTNDELIARGVIRQPMSAIDIWAVTDIHIGSGQGISVLELKDLLPSHRLLATRSYGFFSVLENCLPDDLKAIERELIQQQSLEGCYVSAAWQKRSA